MGTRFVTAGYGDTCTYPIGTCDPQCIDHEAIRAKADMSAGCIVNGLKAGKEETQIEVGEKIAAFHPSWLGDIASICVGFQQAAKEGRLDDMDDYRRRLMDACCEITNMAIDECAEDRAE